MTVDECNEYRRQIKAVADSLRALGLEAVNDSNKEATANVMLAYRHLEDASMRLGRVIQALDRGVSVYDKASTVGA